MLRHQVTLRSPLSSQSARASVVTWLQAIGYGLVSAPFLSSVEAGRGSIMGNMGSLNPKQWQSHIRATFTSEEGGCTIEMEWAVATIGQVVTKADIAYWSYEVGQTLAVAMGTKADPVAFAKEAKKAQQGNVWRALLFTFALLGPLIGIGIATSSFVAGIVSMIFIGAAAWYALKAPRKLEVPVPSVPTPQDPTSLNPRMVGPQ